MKDVRQIDISQKISRSPYPDASDFFTAISVDCVIFGLDQDSLKILLIKSDYPDFEERWSLLGDLVKPFESLNEAAYRVLNERTGLDDLYLEQVQCFGDPDRHPSGRVISVAYFSLVKIDEVKLSKWENELHWHTVHNVGKMAFDHNMILNNCLTRLQDRIKTEPIGFNLLPEKFSLRELQLLYESVLMIELDRRNFRKKILASGWVTDLDEMESNVPRRPAKLFSFNSENFSNTRNRSLFS